MSNREERIYENCKLDILSNWLLFIVRESNVERNSFFIIPTLYDLKVKASKMDGDLILNYKELLCEFGYESLVKYLEVDDFNKLIVPIYIRKYVNQLGYLNLYDIDYSSNKFKNDLIHNFFNQLRNMSFSFNMENRGFPKLLIDKYLSSIGVNTYSSMTSGEYVLESLFILKEIIDLSLNEKLKNEENLLVCDINELIDNYSSDLEISNMDKLVNVFNRISTFFENSINKKDIEDKKLIIAKKTNDGRI